MKTRNIFTACLVLSSGAFSFSAAAQNNYGPNAGDSAHSQNQRPVEIQRDQQQTPQQRIREMGYDASQYANGLVGGGSDNGNKTRIQFDEKNRNK